MKILRYNNFNKIENIKESVNVTEEDRKSLLDLWQEEFKGKKPSIQECYDFYHKVREMGYNGIVVFNVLGQKFTTQEEF